MAQILHVSKQEDVVEQRTSSSSRYAMAIHGMRMQLDMQHVALSQSVSEHVALSI